jgi:hypothetical protein
MGIIEVLQIFLFYLKTEAERYVAVKTIVCGDIQLRVELCDNTFDIPDDWGRFTVNFLLLLFIDLYFTNIAREYVKSCEFDSMIFRA